MKDVKLSFSSVKQGSVIDVVSCKKVAAGTSGSGLDPVDKKSPEVSKSGVSHSGGAVK
ncbi:MULTISPECIES: hypothetical protein [unclassified Pseudoalteromonas]|uniref:hypothetical protein n=1 Tax=unclassified Pseudoalteromonas TaxID=194690 RepID=UPI001571A41F|nr:MULTISPECIES: hypothetical protein [unclassified Pseudoalteromonas]MCF2826802.1 hypothetical protein [Pseudoalteromonas sp. OF5H-5]MCF2926672.1 hypothetical protein [Pseudoalteromonas sp. DL2-H1]